MPAMTTRDLISRLGGLASVAKARGVTRAAVHQWVAADRVPAEHHLALWQMALDAGLDWAPPGADGLRDRLCPRPAPEVVTP
jgi:hypothetical protein